MTTLRAEDFVTPQTPTPTPTTDQAPPHPVKPTHAAATGNLYAGRQKIYAKLAHGTFRNLKWAVMAVTLAIYYLLPWARWPRAEGLPTQAVLADVANGRLYIGPIEIWPQEFYFVTGLLILGALGLFLVTAALGRVWCGYTCPQTVWTDLMIVIERFWQGDRNARMRLDKEPWSSRKVLLKGATHASWLLVSVLTGGAFVFYFRDAPTLLTEFFTGTAPMIAYLFLGVFTATTYLLGAIAREQVCVYMCPWPRIQGAMTDRHTMLVSYRTEVGEPRGPVHKNRDGQIDWSNRGDCIDCKACVAVCPTGIDIRDGSQLECIQCALCIDACNEIMGKIGRPPNLIAYDTIAKRDAGQRGAHEPFRLLRPRTMLYAGVMVFVGAVMLFAYLSRTLLEVNVIPDRAPLYVQLSDGAIRNGYTIKLLNKAHAPRDVTLAIDALPDATLTVAGFPGRAPRITLATDAVHELRVFVTVPQPSLAKLSPPSNCFRVIVRDYEPDRSNENDLNGQKGSNGSHRTTRSVTFAREAIFQSPKP